MTTTYDNVIEQIVQSVFSTMLEIDLLRAEEVTSPDDDSLLVTIPIAGQWMGNVVLELSPNVATEAAAAMLRIPVAEVTETDRREVAAELVNMVGGNLKSMLPAPSYLSLPTILSGRDIGVCVHDAELIDDVALTSSFGPIRVKVYAQLPVAGVA